MAELTPKEIVEELDKYIVGQKNAKRAVAIALRNRYRRSLLDPEMAEEITPKNILMMGPTGVGKTEIARRLAKLVHAPFVKVEATKFTEVGYVGRDVDSMIRDLVEASIRLVREGKVKSVEKQAKEAADARIIDILVPDGKKKKRTDSNPFAAIFSQPSSSATLPAPDHVDAQTPTVPEDEDLKVSTRQAVELQLKTGLLDDQMLEVEVEENSNVIGMDLSSMGIDFNMNDILGNMMPKKRKTRKVSVGEARRIFEQEEADKLIDMDEVTREALKKAENDGIVFIDEIDKVAGREAAGGSGPSVSREGVQRDILPIVEGSTVNTKYGPVKTDHMLFIAAGAFHVAKVEDLIPELQGRFPITVSLEKLTAEDFAKILSEPQNALTKQYQALLSTDGVQLEFEQSGIDAIAEYAYEANETGENLGARRLHGIMENLLDEVSFEADGTAKEIRIDADYVKQRLKSEFDAEMLQKYIL